MKARQIQLLIGRTMSQFFGSMPFAAKVFLFSLLITQLVTVNSYSRELSKRGRKIPDRPYISPLYASWTGWDATFSFACSKGKAISRIRSIHSDQHEDRSWAIYCESDSPFSGVCSWSGWVNWYDQPITYQCSNGVITGMHSKHSNHHEDRLFDFRCCNLPPNYYLVKCNWSGYVNYFDGVMGHSISSRRFLVGVSSYHDNRREDRRWKFLICSLIKFG